MSKKRRYGRELAFKTVFACETARRPWPEVFASVMTMPREEGEENSIGEPGETAEAVERESDFAMALVKRYFENEARIDEAVEASSRTWRLARMDAVDRAILRVAATELLAGTGESAGVVINEAIELAKAYGSDHSARFVNALLDDVLRARDEA